MWRSALGGWRFEPSEEYHQRLLERHMPFPSKQQKRGYALGKKNGKKNGDDDEDDSTESDQDTRLSENSKIQERWKSRLLSFPHDGARPNLS